MIKTYTLFTLLYFVFITANGGEEFRIIEVDPIHDKVTVQNVSGTIKDIGNWWLFSEGESHRQVNDLTRSNTVLDHNQKLVLNFHLQDRSGDVALYQSEDFSNFRSMRDYVQWGGAGHVKELDAVKAGLWTKGTFFEGSGPFFFTGDLKSKDHGKGFWSESELEQREMGVALYKNRLYPNPITSSATLELNRELDMSDVEVRIYDLLGSEVRIVNKFEDHKVRIDRENLLKGIYFYSITKSGKVLDTVKFSVN